MAINSRRSILRNTLIGTITRVFQRKKQTQQTPASTPAPKPQPKPSAISNVKERVNSSINKAVNRGKGIISWGGGGGRQPTVTTTVTENPRPEPVRTIDLQGPTRTSYSADNRTITTYKTGGSIQVRGKNAFDVPTEEVLRVAKGGGGTFTTMAPVTAPDSQTSTQPQKLGFVGELGVGVAKTIIGGAEFIGGTYKTFGARTFSSSEDLRKGFFFSSVDLSKTGGAFGNFVKQTKERPLTFGSSIPIVTAIGFSAYSTGRLVVQGFKAGGVGGALGTVAKTFSPFSLTPTTYYTNPTGQRQLTFVNEKGGVFQRVGGSRDIYKFQTGYIAPSGKGATIGYQTTRQAFTSIQPSGKIESGTILTTQGYSSRFLGSGQIVRGDGTLSVEKTNIPSDIGASVIKGAKTTAGFTVARQVTPNIFRFATGKIPVQRGQTFEGEFINTGIEVFTKPFSSVSVGSGGKTGLNSLQVRQTVSKTSVTLPALQTKTSFGSGSAIAPAFPKATTTRTTTAQTQSLTQISGISTAQIVSTRQLPAFRPTLGGGQTFITPTTTVTITPTTPTTLITTTFTPTTTTSPPFGPPPTLTGYDYTLSPPALPFLGGGDLFGGSGFGTTRKRKFKRQPSFFASYFNIRAKAPGRAEFTGLVERPII